MWPIRLLLVTAISVINVQSGIFSGSSDKPYQRTKRRTRFRGNEEEVIKKKEFVVPPPEQTYTVDQRNVTMTCRLIGDPKPRVWWVYNSNVLIGRKYQILETGDLFIRDVELSDAGNYSCMARNTIGRKSAISVLIVKQHTKIIEKPKDYEVGVGTQATFRCNAVADCSLNLTVKWQRDKRTIHFKRDQRFVMNNDYSLTISKTAMQDTGMYTCLAHTDLDKVTANATLTVVDRPNAPILINTECSLTTARIRWDPNGDNHSPILYYIIEYNTSFTPDTWKLSTINVPESKFNREITFFAMSPWANYTFRVIAVNKVGRSLPSKRSYPCVVPPSFPFKNPDNVEGQGTEPNNLVIRWSPMSEIEHNAPRFHYRVYWQLDTEVDHWNIEDIFDWRQSELLIRDQETFLRYRIKVLAINKIGKAKIAAKEVIGYSGEDKPLEAPTNFTLIQVTNPTSAILSWNPVSEESVQGHFKGYKIQTWTKAKEEDNFRRFRKRRIFEEVSVTADSRQILITILAPNSTNYVRIRAYNGRFEGPPSMTLSINTLSRLPNTIQSLDAIPLGSSAFLLKWKKPLQTNGKLTGYKIYYEEFMNTTLGPRMERKPRINDHHVTEAKLSKLKPNTWYRIYVVGTTETSEGAHFHVDQITGSGTLEPNRPHFLYELQPTENDQVDVKVTWRPNLKGTPGLHFFINYRLKGETQWISTDLETYEIHHTVHNLVANSIYEFRVVSIDGEYQTESFTQEIYTFGKTGLKVVLLLVAKAAIVMIAFIVLLLITIHVIKRNRNTNNYDFQNREVTYANNEYVEASVFSKYSKPLSSPFWRFSEFLSKSIQTQRRQPASNDYEYPQWIYSPQTPHMTPNAIQNSREISNIYEEIN